MQAFVDVFNRETGVRVVSGGTDNHLLLLEVSDLGINGKEAEKALDSVSITVNKNAIPFDPRSIFETSGIRIGTAAITSRGMKEGESVEIAKKIIRTLRNIGNEEELKNIHEEILALTKKFPIESI
jgi:glycine hydroxymethyltransferase